MSTQLVEQITPPKPTPDTVAAALYEWAEQLVATWKDAVARDYPLPRPYLHAEADHLLAEGWALIDLLDNARTDAQSEADEARSDNEDRVIELLGAVRAALAAKTRKEARDILEEVA